MSGLDQGLLDAMGSRKVRLLLAALARELWSLSLQKAESKGKSVEHIRSAAWEALDASDRFADTGKSKTALKAAHRRLLGVAFDPGGVGSAARMLTASLVSQELSQTLRIASGVPLQLSSADGQSGGSLSRKPTIDEVLPLFRQWREDLAPPTEEARTATQRHPSEVLDLAQRIYANQDFARMAELAACLERHGCAATPLLDHLRSQAPHIRGCWALDLVLGERIAKPKALKKPKGTQKRHQLLGRELHSSWDETLAILEQSVSEYRAYTQEGVPNQQFPRELFLDTCLGYPVFEHLGYGPMPNLASQVNLGVDAALDYFFGDWWRACDADARALDKTRPDRELQWLAPLQNGLLLAGLAGREKDFRRLATWVDHRLSVQYRAGQGAEYPWLYLCLADEIGSIDIQDAPAMKQALRTSRVKHPRLLAAVLDAIVAKDQKAFDKAIKESVRYFLATFAEDVPNANFWVARDESLMCLLAAQRGLKQPALSEELAAAIVTRQTAGLSS